MPRAETPRSRRAGGKCTNAPDAAFDSTRARIIAARRAAFAPTFYDPVRSVYSGRCRVPMRKPRRYANPRMPYERQCSQQHNDRPPRR
ncbi:hypothetical protein K788_0002530 [Paraburkholderia caribensis MBA4]|uniref:Uncharacterized protein n=1 Tax=Paraburkholderia caribensis MBA4 TaxID=1323664 RepID=A0A0P0RA75_9BURK|nr:hypothetical protein K788_0002530 [Paraburkholderia caribensis MBA4]